MPHQTIILPVVKPQCLQIGAVAMRFTELQDKARDTVVNGVAATMNDARVGEKDANQADQLEIVWHLVDNSKRIRGPLAQVGKMLRSQDPGQLWSHRCDRLIRAYAGSIPKIEPIRCASKLC
ncbi:hypothetical protein AJ88_07810 [Mesorhizobium amorphae CCBAU 01583]|nr:hypothetical protein AJ88_07810 [Mesorhizobium amorphae CCBAU 01583]